MPVTTSVAKSSCSASASVDCPLRGTVMLALPSSESCPVKEATLVPMASLPDNSPTLLKVNVTAPEFVWLRGEPSGPKSQ